MDYSKGVDLPAFLKWKFAHEREQGKDEARRKYAHVEQTIEEAQAMGWIGEDEAKRRKLVAQMAQEEYKAAELSGLLIRTEEAADIVSGEYAIVREAFLSLPSKAAPRLGSDDEMERRGVLEEEIDRILADLQADARYQAEIEDGANSAQEIAE